MVSISYPRGWEGMGWGRAGRSESDYKLCMFDVCGCARLLLTPTHVVCVSIHTAHAHTPTLKNTHSYMHTEREREEQARTHI